MCVYILYINKTKVNKPLLLCYQQTDNI